MKMIRGAIWFVLFAAAFGTLFGCAKAKQRPPQLYSNVGLEGLRVGNMIYITGIRTPDGVYHQVTNTRWMGVAN